MAKDKLIETKNLRTYFYTEEGVVKALDGVDFEIYPGETLGIVGESGCGKSVTALSIMRLIESPPGEIVSGEIVYDGKDLTTLSQKEMRKIRGNRISMIFQEPMTSLNPVYTVGDQIAEAILTHKDVNKKEAREQSIEMLQKFGIPLPEQRVDEYPHQLSGGMRQRVMIAMALSCNPNLLIADEPTTALDVTIQAQILDLMNDLKGRFDMSIMMITHDLGVIAEVSDRVAVMYAGKIVECTDVDTLFANPRHPYTWGLMSSIPSLKKEVDRLEAIPGIVPNPLVSPEGCKFHPRCPLADDKCRSKEPQIEEVEDAHKVSCWHYKKIEKLKEKGSTWRAQKVKTFAAEEKLLEVKNLKKYFPVRSGVFRKTVGYVKAVDNISFTIKKGETLGLVGESGCGKSTIGRTILGLLKASSGEIYFEGNNILSMGKQDMRSMRKEMQLIFQDPYASLDPRMTVVDIVGEPLDIHNLVRNKKEKTARVEKILKSVGLSKEHLERYPHEFSGGQRQRIGIARALVLNPKLVICDEPVSALDVSIQAQVINLMQDLQNEFDLTYLFITHDLSVVKHISDRIAVMYLGQIIELAEKKELFADPLHPYTQSLISAIPIADPTYKKKGLILEGDVPSPVDPPSGCRFCSRCLQAMDICSKEEPEFKEYKEGHFSACHLLD